MWNGVDVPAYCKAAALQGRLCTTTDTHVRTIILLRMSFLNLLSSCEPEVGHHIQRELVQSGSYNAANAIFLYISAILEIVCFYYWNYNITYQMV